MKIEKYTINELTPYVCGENGLATKYLTGRELVRLFNQYGIRDVYDNSIGLPKINPTSTLNTSRKDYTRDRLNKLNGRNELKQLLELVVNTADNPKDAKNQIAKILSHDGYSVETLNEQYFIIGGGIEVPIPIENQVKFKDIENEILINLEKARVSIVVAVAWFTNQTLADKLMQKKAEGLTVEVVVFKDGVNSRYEVELGDIPVYKLRGERGGIMHNKFCVIDNQLVGIGSYNWTKNAETRNDETFQFSLDPNLATEYSEKFNRFRLQALSQRP